MKRFFAIIAVLTVVICAVVFTACDALNGGTTSTTTTTDTSNTSGSSDAGGGTTDASGADASALQNEPAADETFEEITEASGDFVIVTEDGEYSEASGVYTLTKAGTYTLSGSLTGQILVDAGEDDEVVLELNGVTITYGSDSPIKVVAADKVEISAKKETNNVIKDTRGEKTVDSDEQGEGAISANCDLKLKGNGVLVVEAGYNNGVHTTKDLTIKNLSLKVTAVNNALKGKDSITMESGTVVAISTKGDGVKTEDTDLSSKGNQRGTVTLSDGSLTIYAAGDAVQASYDFVMNGGSMTVYTGSYSSYTASSATTTSYKGIKVGNELKIIDGTLTIYSYDDGLHADYGTSLENGATGKGNITISGGSVTVAVYSPTKSTATGRSMRGGWGGWSNQQSVSGSDAIHADNTLTVSGGTVTIDSAYEGLEATHILIQGGTTTVYATDDGVNAAKKADNSPTIVVSGGTLDVTVPSGDTDGIDSNGTYTQTGGVVIARGPGSASGGMGGGACAMDMDGGITLKGGTLIVFGGVEGTLSASGVTKTLCSSSTVSAGTHTVTVGGTTYTVELKYSSSGCLVYSDGGSATLK